MSSFYTPLHSSDPPTSGECGGIQFTIGNDRAKRAAVSFNRSNLKSWVGVRWRASSARTSETNVNVRLPGDLSIRTKAALLLLATALLAAPIFPCSVIGGPEAPESLVRHAPIIVRASAVEYERSPEDPDVWTIGMPASFVRFEVEEVVKGADIPGSLVLPGYLRKRDDWNDHEPPYTFVRGCGSFGSGGIPLFSTRDRSLEEKKSRNPGDKTFRER